MPHSTTWHRQHSSSYGQVAVGKTHTAFSLGSLLVTWRRSWPFLCNFMSRKPSCRFYMTAQAEGQGPLMKEYLEAHYWRQTAETLIW